MITDKNGNNWYKIGLHIHTSRSDGGRQPEDAAAFYKERGFDAVAFTDHWVYGEECELAGIKVFSGCEYDRGGVESDLGVWHIVGIGMTSKPDLVPGPFAQGLIDKINEAGGIAILAHPMWSLNSPEQIKKLHGLAAVEIYNTVSGIENGIRPDSSAIIDILANEGYVLPLVAADDIHGYGDIACRSYVMVRLESLTRECLLNAIRNGDFYATQGPELYTHREGNKIIADFSECVKVKFVSNLTSARRVFQGASLTHSEYEVRPNEKWVRVEVVDKGGNTAWSNIFDFR